MCACASNFPRPEYSGGALSSMETLWSARSSARGCDQTTTSADSCSSIGLLRRDERSSISARCCLFAERTRKFAPQIAKRERHTHTRARPQKKMGEETKTPRGKNGASIALRTRESASSHSSSAAIRAPKASSTCPLVFFFLSFSPAETQRGMTREVAASTESFSDGFGVGVGAHEDEPRVCRADHSAMPTLEHRLRDRLRIRTNRSVQIPSNF